MAPDPVRVADTRAWPAKVASDPRCAEIDLTATHPLLDDLAFHCQQAAEKALKALLVWHDEPFRKTHNLEEIGRQCIAIDPTLRELVDRAIPLTDYVWEFRYPGDEPVPTMEEAMAALALAREVVAAVHARLPAETHP